MSGHYLIWPIVMRTAPEWLSFWLGVVGLAAVEFLAILAIDRLSRWRLRR